MYCSIMSTYTKHAYIYIYIITVWHTYIIFVYIYLCMCYVEWTKRQMNEAATKVRKRVEKDANKNIHVFQDAHTQR